MRQLSYSSQNLASKCYKFSFCSLYLICVAYYLLDLNMTEIMQTEVNERVTFDSTAFYSMLIQDPYQTAAFTLFDLAGDGLV